VAEEKLFECFKTLLFCNSLTDQLAHHVVHNLHEACHLLLCEFLLLCEVAVHVRELLQDGHLSALLLGVLKVFSDTRVVEPRLTDLLALLVRGGADKTH